MKVTCGVLLADMQGRWLICHSTHNKHWDLPKGIANPGEDHEDAALRELKEETGLALDMSKVFAFTDLGQHPYAKEKDLHLFHALTTQPIDTSVMVCESMVVRPTHSFPEMDAFALLPPEEAVLKLSARMLAWLDANLPKKFLKPIL